MKKKLIKGISPDKEIVRKIWMTMRLIVLLLFVSLMHVSASVYSQKTKLNIKVENATLQQVFKALQDQSEFDFFYKNEQIPADTRVSVALQNETVEVILNQVLNGTGLSYHVLDKDIVISSKEIANNANTQQQQNVIKGKVTDQTGAPLPGASVIVKGTTNGAVTNADGLYTLANVPSNGTIVFSFIGMKTQEIQVGGKTVFNVSLAEETIGLDEVVAIGYGTVKKSDVMGALVSVSEKTIKERPVQNAVDAMQGKAAGVDIVTNIRPGTVSSVSIRGTRSITASNAPLYVVDGVILFGDLNDINPSDIASMEILKDASSTAIYGSRGANGVILITTKQGKKGKMDINYEGNVTLNTINSLTKWATAGEALDRYRQAYINAGAYKSGTTAYTEPNQDADNAIFGNSDAATLAAIAKGYEGGTYDASKIPTTDWVSLLTKTGVTQNHQLSLSSGNDVSKIYLSLGYLNNDGTQKNQGYTRYTIKLNAEVTPKKWVTVGTSLNISKSVQDYGTINRSGSATGANDLYGAALSQLVMGQPYDSDGNIILYPGGNKTTPIYNPIIDIDNTADRRNSTNIQANIYGEVHFTPWLRYRLNVGLGMNRYNRGTWQSSQSTLRVTTAGAGSYASYETSDNFQYLIENLLYFDKTFGIHTIGATLMQSNQSTQTEGSSMSASKIFTDASKWYDLSSNLNGKPDSYSTSYTKQQMVSFMGRVNYSLKNRYLATFTGRYDASSVLAEGHKWAFFPSGSLAWKMNEENFIRNIGWIDELKLRTGYGVTGNASVDAYSTTGPLSRYNYVFGTTAAISFLPYKMANPNLTWEKTAQTNIGLDFSVLKNCLSGSIEVYNSNTTGLLLDRTIPAFTGYTFITDNIGKLNNKGLEITLTTRNMQKKDFSWTTNWSWSHNKEKIVELVNGKVDMTGNGWYIGQPVSVFRSYVVDGLWQNNATDLAEIALWKANGYTFSPGQYKPVEQGTPDHKLTDADKVIRGSDRPKWIGGMTNTFTYKDFTLSFFIYARVGQKYFSSLIPGGSTGGKYVGYVRKAGLDEFWSDTNPNARWPKLTTATEGNADVTRATYINDGSFVSVRNISLSYNVPKKYLSKVNIDRLQVYTQVLNPFIFGGDVVKQGINPDDTNGWKSVNSVGDSTGGTNNNTMMVTSFVFGVRVGF
jgi:TonB-linked SusC/RagA family outer membrane protein